MYFLQGFRSTPELSFCVRYKRCSCGIMVTASHNPPSDNAVKAYWSTGGQLLPPHDKGVIDRVMAVEQIDRASFDRDIAQIRRLTPGPVRRTIRRVPDLVGGVGDVFKQLGLGPRMRAWITKEGSIA